MKLRGGERSPPRGAFPSRFFAAVPRDRGTSVLLLWPYRGAGSNGTDSMGADERGVTLVEAVLALVVLGIGALALASTGLIAIRAGAHAALEQRAVVHAHDRLAALATGASGALGCTNLPPGRLVHPDGVLEDWSLVSAPRGWLVQLRFSAPEAAGSLHVLVTSRVACLA
jgi:pilin/secretion family protein with methylation motif